MFKIFVIILISFYFHLFSVIKSAPVLNDKWVNFDHCYSECIQRYYAKNQTELVLCISGCAVGQPPPGCNLKGACLPYISSYNKPIFGGYSIIKHPYLTKVQ